MMLAVQAITAENIFRKRRPRDIAYYLYYDIELHVGRIRSLIRYRYFAILFRKIPPVYKPAFILSVRAPGVSRTFNAHLEEEKFYFPYMYYFKIFTNTLRNNDAILRTFQLPLVP